jgi:hypothetical protein
MEERALGDQRLRVCALHIVVLLEIEPVRFFGTRDHLTEDRSATPTHRPLGSRAKGQLDRSIGPSSRKAIFFPSYSLDG